MPTPIVLDLKPAVFSASGLNNARASTILARLIVDAADHSGGDAIGHGHLDFADDFLYMWELASATWIEDAGVDARLVEALHYR